MCARFASITRAITSPTMRRSLVPNRNSATGGRRVDGDELRQWRPSPDILIILIELSGAVFDLDQSNPAGRRLTMSSTLTNSRSIATAGRGHQFKECTATSDD